ncbi:MAG TPA: peptidoglycan DD-metalloendopeptidase family protein [Geminicoccaceae bacterium]|nr:peptidoglycan DD-metalloendopeptidase family protein [Geminicoccaceae bacterium]
MANGQVAAAAISFALAASVTVISVSYADSRNLLSDSARQIRDLEGAYAGLLSDSQLSTLTLMEQIGGQEATTEHQHRVIRELTAIQEILARQLDSRDRQLAGIAEERDKARAMARELAQAMAGVEELMQEMLAEEPSLKEQLQGARGSLAKSSQQRDAERQAEIVPGKELAPLGDEIQQPLSRRETAQAWLKDWVLGSTEALEQLFVETGVDVETLLERAPTPSLGQGGPFQVAGVDLIDGRLALLRPSDPMQNDIERLSALQTLARSLPLASPLDDFELSSGFGKRRDPFTRGWAFHAGLDFRAAAGSRILATAPGQVIHAGPAGPYGKMVEIDHGMGVVTRYGHMKAISVAVGDEVQSRQEIGVIGTTGRSTSLHLHYEIRIDEIAHDPARFIDAGRLLVDVSANAGHEPADDG